MHVAVVNVFAVRVNVIDRLVAMRVGVLTDDGLGVRVGVMAVVVAVRVIVLHRRVTVRVFVALGGVNDDARGEEQARGCDTPREPRWLEQQPQPGADERSE